MALALSTALRPITDEIAHILNIIEEIKTRLLNLPEKCRNAVWTSSRDMYENCSSYAREKRDYLFSFKVYIDNIMSIPSNVFVWVVEKAKETVSNFCYPFKACYVAIVTVPMKIFSLFTVAAHDADRETFQEYDTPSEDLPETPGQLMVRGANVDQAGNEICPELVANQSVVSSVRQGVEEEPCQQHVRGTCCSNLVNHLRKPWDATEPIRTRASAAKETVTEFVNDMPDSSARGGLRLFGWMLVWLVTTSMLGVWNVAIPAALTRLSNIGQRFVVNPVQRARQTFEYVEDILGDVVVKVVRIHGEAKILVQSYSSIPPNVLMLIIRDRIRTRFKFRKLRSWIRDNLEIPVVVEDSRRNTLSRHTLSSSGDDDEIKVTRRGEAALPARPRRRGNARR